MHNYFKLLNLPEKFDISVDDLYKSYFYMQAEYHPDKASNAEDKILFSNLSTQINEAYANLKDDFKRSLALLSIAGIDFNDEKIRNELENNFLQKQIDEFELLDSLEDSSKLSDMLQQKQLERAELIKSLRNFFSIKNIKEACKLTISLKYIDNIIERIKLKLQKLQNI